MARNRANFKVEGLTTLRRDMRKAGVDLEELKDSNRSAAGVVHKYAKPGIPKDSEALVKTIRFGATQKSGYIRLGKKSVPYAGPIHFGWEKRGIKPRAVISEAAVEHEPEWVQVYMSHISKILKKIGRKK